MEKTAKDLSSGGGLLALWFAFFAGPVAWLLNLQVSYILVPVACATGHALALYIIPLGALLLAASGLLVAWREWLRAGKQWPDESSNTIGRSRFMAVLALLVSTLFFLAILAQAIPNFILGPCQK
ncbi:MAG TPA: hypothetical protein VNN73_11055 [Blastocatellia bacterium]|nr:hypothetical protein [Blastocatellia bacterium]